MARRTLSNVSTLIDTLMTAPAVTARSDEPLVDLIDRMHRMRVGSVVVVDDAQHAVGIVTERDVLRLDADGRTPATTVGEAMTVPVDTIERSDEGRMALERMRERGYRHMPVVDHGRVAGVLSLRDLMRLADLESTHPPEIPPGLKGVVVADTEVGDVRGAEGFYHYRQYSAIELAEQRTLDDVWQLMIDGVLPTRSDQRDAFRAEVRDLGALPDGLDAMLPVIARHAEPLDGLRTALSYVAHADGMRPLIDIDHAQRRRDALRLCAVTPRLLTTLWRLRAGLEPVAPDPDARWATNYVRMLTGTDADPRHVAAVERYLISTVDHGFNASTFTARVVSSTGADMGASIVAAIGALSGPLHGGAPSRALALLDEIGGPDVLTRRDPTAAIDAVVRPMIERGEKMMGFGHAVYRGDDPRSLMLRDVARDLGGPLVDLAVLVEQRVVELLAELKPGRDLRTNVEFYAGVVMELCGIPRSMFTPTFASSRVIGWCANVLEQAAANKIIRPSARYVGPPPPRPVPAMID
jgi:citrate synthase